MSAQHSRSAAWPAFGGSTALPKTTPVTARTMLLENEGHVRCNAKLYPAPQVAVCFTGREFVRRID
jgi:hypothetical protein